MDTTRITALLEPFLEQPLSPSHLDQISTYIDLLLRWNARINLTAIRHPEEIVTRHFGESLFLARHLFPANASSVARAPSPADPNSAQPPATPHSGLYNSAAPPVLDIGSGAGFPALPLKLWAPHIDLTLVESNHKKAAFLREVAPVLTLTNGKVITHRVEVLAARSDFPRTKIVTLRAVERFASILPPVLTLLAPNGTLALLIGAAQVTYLTTLPAIKWCAPIPVPQSHTRVLSIGIRE